MNSDLERLIALQRLDSAADAARRRLADEPERQKSLETRLESARQRVTHAKEQFTANQAARREIDKEVAVHQGRLSKYREQAMAVKTNVEYHAIQKEIAHAQAEIKTHEDRMLERMLEADDLTAAVKKAEADLAAEQKAVDGDRKAMTAEHTELQASLEQNRRRTRRHRRRARQADAGDFRARLETTQRRRARGGTRRHLHDLPRPPAPAGVQQRPPERRDHPVRQLQPDPLLRGGARRRGAKSLSR